MSGHLHIVMVVALKFFVKGKCPHVLLQLYAHQKYTWL